VSSRNLGARLLLSGPCCSRESGAGRRWQRSARVGAHRGVEGLQRVGGAATLLIVPEGRRRDRGGPARRSALAEPSRRRRAPRPRQPATRCVHCREVGARARARRSAGSPRTCQARHVVDGETRPRLPAGWREPARRASTGRPATPPVALLVGALHQHLVRRPGSAAPAPRGRPNAPRSHLGRGGTRACPSTKNLERVSREEVQGRRQPSRRGPATVGLPRRPRPQRVRQP